MPTSYSTGWKSNKASAKALEEFQAGLAKDMGLEILRTSSKPTRTVIPTGSLALDAATQIGGYPTSQIVEIWGPSDAGKTTTAMLAVANAQRVFPDQVAGWIDMEQTFDAVWAETLGVDLKRLVLVPNPHTAEDVSDITKRMVHRGIFSLVVVDSVGAMITRSEYEKESDEATVAAVARVVTRLVKQCSAMCKANGTTLMIINQVRANIGTYGGTITRTGGFALTHVTAMRLNLRAGREKLTIKGDGIDIPVGHEIVAKVEKNKLAPAGYVANFFLINQATEKYGPVGIDKAAEAFKVARDLDLLGTGGGGRYTVPNGTEEPLKLVGKDAVVAHFRAHPEQVELIRTAMLANKDGLVEQPGGDFAEADYSEEMAAILDGEK